MITDEDARELVKSLRICAARNKTDGDGADGGYLRGQCHGRSAAYALAAKWLEEINHEEAENAQAS